MGGFASSMRRGPFSLAFGLLLAFAVGPSCGQSSSASTSATSSTSAGGAPSEGTPPGSSSGGASGGSGSAGSGAPTSGSNGGAAGGGGATPTSAGPSPTPSSPPPDPCAGLVPAQAGTPVQISLGTSSSCGPATSDPSGRITLASWNGFAWQMTPYTPAGSPVGAAMQPLSPNSGDLDRGFHWTASGFRGIIRGPAQGFPTMLQTWDVSGTPIDSSYRGVVAITPDGQGGSVAIVPDASSLPNVVSAPKFLDWIDARGVLTRAVALDQDAGAVLVNWNTGHVFVLVLGNSTHATQGRWYDGDGKPLTGWFSLDVANGTGATWHLLVDGTIVLAGPGGDWVVATADGVEGPRPVPDWLASRPRTRLSTLRGGRGYAIVAAEATDRLDIVATSGASCGTVTLPIPALPVVTAPGATAPRLDIGQDGTVLHTFSTGSNTGARTCTFDWWPALLR